jgi:hypothetical protein
MKSERIILSFVAVLVGLVVAGIAFYFYQMTKTVSEPEEQKKNVANIQPSPTPDKSLFLTVENPKDGAVLNKKTITVSGKTVPNTTIIISSENGDDVITPAKNGDFTTTETISDGSNLMQVTAIFQNGEEKKVQRTVTFSTENF